MIIWEVSEKVDYIAERHHRLQDQWRIYCSLLVQGVTLSEACLHRAISCAPDKDLYLVLLEHFIIYVTLVDGFNSHTIGCYAGMKDGDDKQLIAQVELAIDGKVDERISNHDREQVLKHYLEKIATAYGSLYIAVENNMSVNLGQLIEGYSPTQTSGAVYFIMVRPTHCVAMS